MPDLYRYRRKKPLRALGETISAKAFGHKADHVLDILSALLEKYTLRIRVTMDDRLKRTFGLKARGERWRNH